MKRNKAIAVDLSEFEQVRRNIEENYEDQLVKMRMSKSMGPRQKKLVQASLNSDKLKAMHQLNRQKN